MIKMLVENLRPGMVLAKPLTDERGNVLLHRDITLSAEYISGLRRRGFAAVYVNDGDTDDVLIEDLLSDEVRLTAQASLARVFDAVKAVAADFSSASPDAAVACIQDSSVQGSLQRSETFQEMEKSVTEIVTELLCTETLTGLAQIRSHDDVTFSHSIDVTVTAIMIGKRLYLNQADLRRLGMGCMLHDVGKVFVLPSILQKRTPLTPVEQERLREHPRLGYELLRTRNPDAVMVNHVALEHHERQDGKGYPRGLHGTNSLERQKHDRQNILLISEIAAVADVYDILSVEKPGRVPLTPHQIADTMLRLSGTVLNRQIVRHFLSILPLFPVGIPVVVRTGSLAGYSGIVIQSNPKLPDRPLIRLLNNPQGDRVLPIEMDLARERNVVVEAMLGK